MWNFAKFFAKILYIDCAIQKSHRKVQSNLLNPLCETALHRVHIHTLFEETKFPTGYRKFQELENPDAKNSR